ncbi:ABC transporter ATP-binding protein [Anaerolentibacter hominis]|uniref:ABC transporter ATP-binding protein n=1 Tax=Anaerolentibacter hominis TaxID=3079009 RepID=UPI0031B898F0
MEKILEVNDLQFRYGEIVALRGISFYVEEGEIVTLLGGNGAGKTTTLQAVSGLIHGIYGGEIRFMGEKINHLAPHKIAGMGIAQCIEGRHIFSQLTVKENLMMGAYLRKGEQIRADLDYVYDLFPRLKERETQQGGTLSGGEQQMLAVGRALMQKPKLLMMDEPSLGLAPLIVEDIFRAVKKINTDGIPVLLVEQNCNVALDAAGRGYVMETGEIIFQDTAQKLLENEDIQRSYMGIS